MIIGYRLKGHSKEFALGIEGKPQQVELVELECKVGWAERRTKELRRFSQGLGLFVREQSGRKQRNENADRKDCAKTHDYTPITPHNSFTAAALLSNPAFSSGVSLISMICSIPFDPSFTGTPIYSPRMPYSP
jgi:hypothetical protein